MCSQIVFTINFYYSHLFGFLLQLSILLVLLVYMLQDDVHPYPGNRNGVKIKLKRRETERESETNECNIQTSWSWFATSKRAHVLEFCYVYIFVCMCFFCVSIYFNAKVMSKFVYLCQNFLYNFRWIFGFWERCGKLICFKRKWIHGDFLYLFLSFCFPFVVKCHEPINQCDSQININ